MSIWFSYSLWAGTFLPQIPPKVRPSVPSHPIIESNLSIDLKGDTFFPPHSLAVKAILSCTNCESIVLIFFDNKGSSIFTFSILCILFMTSWSLSDRIFPFWPVNEGMDFDLDWLFYWIIFPETTIKFYGLWFSNNSELVCWCDVFI